VNWFTAVAVFFVLWWIVLFAVLPFGVRTQIEDDAVEPGTAASAPSRPHFARAVMHTTWVTAILFGMFYVAVAIYGFSFADLPVWVPEQFRSNS
jgi:predicted secreted protein